MPHSPGDIWSFVDRVRHWSARESAVSYAQLCDLISDWPHRCGGLRWETIGASVEGRAIHRLSLGDGDVHVMLWAQMHGDETTHTGILLDLAQWLSLARLAPPSARDPVAAEILGGATLHLIPMLNPDGAVRGTRFNAQGIDINRDARALATPEGRALRDAFRSLRPQAGFNLHDQDRHKAIDGQCAAVSLLAPPVDAQATETENFVDAQRLGSCFRLAVEPYCDRMISRYEVDYMPRAFGEWLQSQGMTTLLVEAGGWRDDARAELKKIHLCGLVQCLRALASGRLSAFDREPYLSLPKSSTHKLFDLLVHQVRICNGLGHLPFDSDLGINFPASDAAERPGHRPAQVADLGDLAVTTGRRCLAGMRRRCLPGRIVYQPELTPLNWMERDRWSPLIHQGVTTAIGVVPLEDAAQVQALQGLQGELRPALHMGFVGRWPETDTAVTPALRDQFLRALTQGILGLAAPASPIDAEWLAYLRYFELPLLDLAGGEPHLLPATADPTWLACENYRTAKSLGLEDHGSIQRGTVADLLLYDAEAPGNDDRPWEAQLRLVLLGGRVVWDADAPVGTEFPDCGCFLRRRPTALRHVT